MHILFANTKLADSYFIDFVTINILERVGVKVVNMNF